jgi:hypothetical protein
VVGFIFQNSNYEDLFIIPSIPTIIISNNRRDEVIDVKKLQASTLMDKLYFHTIQPKKCAPVYKHCVNCYFNVFAKITIKANGNNPRFSQKYNSKKRVNLYLAQKTASVDICLRKLSVGSAFQRSENVPVCFSSIALTQNEQNKIIRRVIIGELRVRV